MNFARRTICHSNSYYFVGSVLLLAISFIKPKVTNFEKRPGKLFDTETGELLRVIGW
jgi:hypothetical protein